MGDTRQLRRELASAKQTRTAITRLELLESSENILKARLYFAADLFVQVYCNDRFGTINYALIQGDRRLYARDRLDGQWHRHSVNEPALHDKSEEGQRPVALNEFLDEVETLLIELDLL